MIAINQREDTMSQRFQSPLENLWCFATTCDTCGEHLEFVADAAHAAVARRRAHRRVVCGPCGAAELSRLDRLASRAS